MANSPESTGGAFGLDPRHTQRLRQAVPDLDDGPRSWHVEPADIAVGEQIVGLLAPLLLHLLDQGLDQATVSRQRDNLCTLGGELIRRRHGDDEFANKPVKDAQRERIGGDGGPLIWPRVTEAQQDSLEATCRKLRRFICASSAANPTD